MAPDHLRRRHARAAPPRTPRRSPCGAAFAPAGVDRLRRLCGRLHRLVRHQGCLVSCHPHPRRRRYGDGAQRLLHAALAGPHLVLACRIFGHPERGPADRLFALAVEGYKSGYANRAGLVLVNVAPIPECDQNFAAYASALRGVTSNTLLPLPIGLFNGRPPLHSARVRGGLDAGRPRVEHRSQPQSHDRRSSAPRRTVWPCFGVFASITDNHSRPSQRRTQRNEIVALLLSSPKGICGCRCTLCCHPRKGICGCPCTLVVHPRRGSAVAEAVACPPDPPAEPLLNTA